MKHGQLSLLLPVLFFASEATSVTRRCELVSSESVLRCPGEDQMLTIHSAVYRSPGDPQHNTSAPCKEDVRHFVNKRCSGLPQCQFRLRDEHVRKHCTEPDDGATLDLSFTCVAESSVARFCNGRVETWLQREGYVASPGYPRFYPRLANCSWSLSARPGQSLKLTLLDLHLVGDSKCRRDSDMLTVTQNGALLLEGCGLDNGDWAGAGSQVVESTGPKVTVTFLSHRVAPKRGFLLHYQVQGCPTLAAPTGGYLVSRNASAALYLCCRGHAFNDTGQNALLLRCADGHWDSTYLPTCLPSNTSESEISSRVQEGVIIRIPDRDFMADVVVPTVLMASLLLGNAVVMAVILRIRRQRKDPS